MSRKKSAPLLNKTDVSFLLGVSLILALFSVLLYFNYLEAASDTEQKRIGTLTLKKNIVQRKPQAQVLWKSVLQSYPVYEGDTIRTGKESEALLDVHGKFKIDMDENTIILLDFLKSDKKGRVHIGNGAARFRQANPQESKVLSLDVVDKGRNFSLKGTAEVLLTKNNPKKGLEMAALNDQLKITDDKGEQETLSPNSLLILSEKKLTKQKLLIVPQKPEDGAYVKGSGKLIAVNFSWERQAKTKKQGVQLEVSKYNHFSTFVVRKKITKPSFTAKLEEGLYYWRLLGLGAGAKDSPNHYSLPRKFRVISQKSIKTYRPLPQSVFSYTDSKPFVAFSWSQGYASSSYVLELAKDKEFKNVLIQKKTLALHYGIALGEGQYYWRLREQNDLTNSESLSPSKSFRVVYQDRVIQSLALNLRPKQALDRRELEKNGFILKWKSYPEVKRSEIIVAQDSELYQTLIEEEVSQNFYTIKTKLANGSYYCKVKSYNSQGKLTHSSPTIPFQLRIFKIKLASFSLLRPEKKSRFFKVKVLSDGLRFAWEVKPPSEYLRFKLTIARDKAFQEIILEQETKANALESKAVKEKGAYFWKVTALDEENNSLVGETKPSSFIIEQLAKIEIIGVGKIRGKILSDKGGQVKISTPEGIITTTLDKIKSIDHLSADK